MAAERVGFGRSPVVDWLRRTLPAASGTRGHFGVFAFTLVLVGTALALGVEWREVFDVHDFALRAPDALNALDAEKGLSLSNIGAIIAISTFVLGWILLAIVTLRTRVANRIAAWMVIAGFLATPLLHPVLPGLWGAAVGNAILGSGLAWLGYDIFPEVGAAKK